MQVYQELKQCPFCGSSTLEFAYTLKRSVGVWVKCEICGCGGSIQFATVANGGIHGAEQMAVESWNRRAECK